MPIKPENKDKYPDNWKEIRERIRRRAKDKCEWCSVKNHSIIVRGKWYGVEVYQDEDGMMYRATDGKYIDQWYVGDLEGKTKMLEVVCTVAHLDHDPENNEDNNLAFLCQKCHNNYDRKHRNQTIRSNKLRGQLTIQL